MDDGEKFSSSSFRNLQVVVGEEFGSNKKLIFAFERSLKEEMEMKKDFFCFPLLFIKLQ